jgi:nicotinamidase/pyrazinamidase
MANSALIVVDMQKDFMPDGSLPVDGGYDIVERINELMASFDLVCATQDWHSPNHSSLASNHDGHDVGDIVEVEGIEQYLWPDHCVQQTEGAEFVDELETDEFDEVFRKGDDPRYDSYSGFYDNGHKSATGLRAFLEERKIEEVFVCGVATDYCVKYTVLDARNIGFRCHLIVDACRGVVNEAGDIEESVAEMADAGAEVVSTNYALERPR